jgi:hypothetical protein
MCKSPRESPISTYLLFDEILLGVPVQEPNLEDDIGAGDSLRHVQVPQGITHISTYLIFYEILLGVPVEEPNPEDEVGVRDPHRHVTSCRVSPISTYLIFYEILLRVFVQEPNLEDDVGVGDPLCHVHIPQGVTHQHYVLPCLKLWVMDCTLRLQKKMKTNHISLYYTEDSPFFLIAMRRGYGTKPPRPSMQKARTFFGTDILKCILFQPSRKNIQYGTGNTVPISTVCWIRSIPYLLIVMICFKNTKETINFLHLIRNL